MLPIEPIKEFVGQGENQEPTAMPVNQLALLSFVLGIFAFALVPSAVATDNYDWITAVVSIVGIVLGHIALVGNRSQRDNRLAVRGLIIGWALLGASLTWALINMKTRGHI
jgi:hypothetical protein